VTGEPPKGAITVLKKPIKKIVIEIVPHLTQRYDTAGDWYLDKDPSILHIRASRLDKDLDPNNWFSICVAYHELTEALSCLANNISDKEVDEFDMNFKGDGEPGDNINCPYNTQHAFASEQEKRLLDSLDVPNHNSFEMAIDSLPTWSKHRPRTKKGKKSKISKRSK